jgi:hypothetical protein
MSSGDGGYDAGNRPPLSPLCAGAEYLACDLSTAAITHWLYDWAALVYVLRQWGGAGMGGGGGAGGGQASPPEASAR